MAVNEATFQQFIGKLLDDAGAAMGIGLVLLGDKFGLYKTLAAAGPLTSSELASRTGTAARYVSEWAAAQAAGGYINFDSATERFSISPEQALSPRGRERTRIFSGDLRNRRAAARDLPKVEAAFRTGGGVGWHEHDLGLFRGTERFFRPGYAMHLVSNGSRHWKASRKSSNTARRSQMSGAVMAHRPSCWPRHFRSRDSQASTITNRRIERARELAREAGVADRVTFQRARRKNFPAPTIWLHSSTACMTWVIPVGAATHVKGGFEIGRHMDDRRAFRWRSNRGQSQSGWPPILFCIDADLRPRILVAGGRSCSRRSNR